MSLFINILAAIFVLGLSWLLIAFWIQKTRRPRVLRFPNHISPDGLTFPKGFKWGAASAAHQIEGGTYHNNWTAFERFIRPNGKPAIHTGDTAGLAADHWNRFEEDVPLMQDLGLDVNRFSIEWSRIEPEAGVFDEAAILRYRQWCVHLREKGITPMVTLHHFSEPKWFYDLGGFEKAENIVYFERFVRYVTPYLADLVDEWITINEPEVFAVMGWMAGEFPPGKQDPSLMAQVLENVLVAHARARQVLQACDTIDADGDGVACKVGIAKNVIIFDPKRWWHPLDLYVAQLLNTLYNGAVLKAVQEGRFVLKMGKQIQHEAHHSILANSLDFIGLNHYTRNLVAFDPKAPHGFALSTDPQFETNDMGWELWAQSFYDALKMVGQLNLPIWVTENGTCDDEIPDRRRIKFLQESLFALEAAIQDGLPVQGYIHWAIMDNFEWAHGFKPRFGLYRVDYTTLARHLTGGGAWYKAVIQAHKKA